MERHQRSAYQQKSGRYKKKQKSEWGHVLLFYVLPFLLFNGILFYCVTSRPKVTVDLADTNDYLTAEATVTIHSWFPTKSVKFSMDGVELKAEKGKKRTYTLPISKNGAIEVEVVNLNGMSNTVFEHVNILDDNPPTIENAAILDGVVTLTLSDSQSGVNFDSIYAMDSKNEKIMPLTVDRATNTLSFDMDSAGLHVYAQDKAGNEVQGTFTSHKEGSTETLEGGVDEAATADGTEVTVQ